MHHALVSTFLIWQVLLSPEAYNATMSEYMEYMEGLAQNLPRVMYCHGAGREAILKVAE